MSRRGAPPLATWGAAVKTSPDDPLPMAAAMQWVSKITTVSLEMILPGIGGGWLDAKWGTSFIGPLGFALGLVVGITHLLRMTSASTAAQKSRMQKRSPRAGEQPTVEKSGVKNADAPPVANETDATRVAKQIEDDLRNL